MKKRYCRECKKDTGVYEETIHDEEYLTCEDCGCITARLVFED